MRSLLKTVFLNSMVFVAASCSFAETQNALKYTVEGSAPNQYRARGNSANVNGERLVGDLTSDAQREKDAVTNLQADPNSVGRLASLTTGAGVTRNLTSTVDTSAPTLKQSDGVGGFVNNIMNTVGQVTSIQQQIASTKAQGRAQQDPNVVVKKILGKDGKTVVGKQMFYKDPNSDTLYLCDNQDTCAPNQDGIKSTDFANKINGYALTDCDKKSGCDIAAIGIHTDPKSIEAAKASVDPKFREFMDSSKGKGTWAVTYDKNGQMVGLTLVEEASGKGANNRKFYFSEDGTVQFESITRNGVEYRELNRTHVEFNPNKMAYEQTPKTWADRAIDAGIFDSKQKDILGQWVQTSSDKQGHIVNPIVMGADGSVYKLDKPYGDGNWDKVAGPDTVRIAGTPGYQLVVPVPQTLQGPDAAQITNPYVIRAPNGTYSTRAKGENGVETFSVVAAKDPVSNQTVFSAVLGSNQKVFVPTQNAAAGEKSYLTGTINGVTQQVTLNRANEVISKRNYPQEYLGSYVLQEKTTASGEKYTFTKTDSLNGQGVLLYSNSKEPGMTYYSYPGTEQMGIYSGERQEQVVDTRRPGKQEKVTATVIYRPGMQPQVMLPDEPKTKTSTKKTKKGQITVKITESKKPAVKPK